MTPDKPTPLQLIQKYGGFSYIESEVDSALNNLDIVRDATRSAIAHMHTDSEKGDALLEALSLVKRYLEQTRDDTRREKSILRGILTNMEEEQNNDH